MLTVQGTALTLESFRPHIRMVRAGAFAALFVLVVVPSNTSFAHAQDSGESGILRFVFENDLFYDNDRNYTNGVCAAWLAGRGDTPAWALRIARAFSFVP